MRVFTVLGPPQSGKSTLAEALGGLDGKAVLLKISESVSLRSFSYINEPWCAIDIAGGPDEMARIGPALAASDAAVLCVPADPEAAVLSAPYLRLIEEAGIPCFLFVNRMDVATARVRDIIAAFQSFFGHNIVLRQVPIREDGVIVGAVDLISERAWQYHDDKPSDLVEIPDQVMNREQEERIKLLESLADFDIDLLEQLVEDKKPATDEVFDITKRVLEQNELCPAFLGVASHGNGVTRLMKSLRHEAPEFDVAKARATDDPDALGIGVLADVRKHIGKMVVIRAFGLGIGAGKQLGGDSIGGLTEFDPRVPLKNMQPGQIGLALKSDHLNAGRIFTETGSLDLPDWAKCHPPAYRRMVSPTRERDDVRLSNALSRMTEIDPGFVLEQDEATGKPILAMQGPLHARRFSEKLAADFGIDFVEESVAPTYCETISKSVEKRYRHRKQSGGAGQFADVVIELKPRPRGAGYEFNEVVKGGAVPRNFISAVAAGVEDALLEGPGGYRVVDVSVTLKDGKHHAVDSSDYAFRMAGKNAVREALRDARPLMLQPISRVDIHVPSVFAGGLVPTISGLGGQVLGFETNPDATGWEVFSALLPSSLHDGLFRALGRSAKGTAWAVTSFDHYEEVDASDIVKSGDEKQNQQA